MKYIISGTNRPGSRSLQVSNIVKGIYEGLGEKVEVISLDDVGLQDLTDPQFGGVELTNEKMKATVEKINSSEGLIFVVPEYNGSFPGALKYFIDHWSYPDSFEHRPMCFIGLGGQWGGLRPVEHLQGVFGYRNAFMFPDRVFLSNIWTLMADGKIGDEKMMGFLEKQASGFQKFVKGLKSVDLVPN